MKRIPLFLSILLMTVSCKSGTQTGENPFFSAWETPYGVPPFDRIAPGHFMPAFERAMSLHDAEIEAIVSNNDEPTFENVIVAYDKSGLALEQAGLVFGMLCEAESNEELRALQEQAMPLLAAHADRIGMNERLFAKVKSVYDRRAEFDLDADAMRLLEKTYRDFVRSGALLDEERKARLKAINEELALNSVKFGANLLAENNNFALELTIDDLEGIPTTARELAREKARELGKSDRFRLHAPQTESDTFSDLFQAPRSARTDLQSLSEPLLQRRPIRQPAVDQRFRASACREGPPAGLSLLRRLCHGRRDGRHARGGLRPAGRNLDSGAETRPGRTGRDGGPLQAGPPRRRIRSWDWWYYAEKLRRKNYALDEEMLTPYFSLENVQSGVFFLANRLYGITFRPLAVPVYHPDVTAYEVLDADESHLGVLYFDYFPREGKSQGAWCGNYVEQRYDDNGGRVAPVVSIVANFTRPTGNTPALLTLDETETLFHEFGHALHFLFHDVKYRGLSEVEGDFVELPSQVMENWAFEPEMLKFYAVHYRNDEPIPAYLVEKLRKSEFFNQGFVTTELIAAALSDMDIHSIGDYEPFDVGEFGRRALNEKRGLIPQIEPRYRYPYFSHIFDGGYSAGYYFYTWAEVLDKDAFEAFRESGDLFNRQIAHDFRYKLLARGGSEDGMALYRAFRGKDPDKRAMLLGRGLIEPEPEPVDESEPVSETPAAE